MVDAAEKTDAAEAADQLQTKLDRAERDAAIARASEAEAKRRSTSSAAEAQRFREQAESATTIALSSTVTGLEQERDKLKADYSQALADGEFDKASDIQFKMSEVAAKLTNATTQKAQLEAAKTTRADDPQLKDKPFDKEAFLASRSPASAAWLRDHDAYFTDAAFNSRVAGAHSLAVGKGLKVDSPEYFEFIEKQALKGEEGDGGEADPPPRKKGNPNFAAPPSRDGGTGRPKLQPGDRYISAEMRHYAEDVCKVTAEQYYDSYLSLVEEGKIEDRFGVLSRR